MTRSPRRRAARSRCARCWIASSTAPSIADEHASAPGPSTAPRNSPSVSSMSRTSRSMPNASTSVSSRSRSSSLGVSSASSVSIACGASASPRALLARARRCGGARPLPRAPWSTPRHDARPPARRAPFVRRRARRRRHRHGTPPPVLAQHVELLRDHRDVRRDPVDAAGPAANWITNSTKTNGRPIDISRWLRVVADRHHHAVNSCVADVQRRSARSARRRSPST